MLTTSIFREFAYAKSYMKATGSFGNLSGKVQAEGNTLWAEKDGCRMTSRFDSDAYDVISRKDTLCNVSQSEILVTSMKSRFLFDGGEYEI